MRSFCFTRLPACLAFPRGVAVAGFVLLAACGGALKTDVQMARERARAYVQSHPELDQKTRETILGSMISVGMTKEQVLAAWGRPIEINRFRKGRQEEWVFGCDYPHTCISMDDDGHRRNLFDRLRYESQAIFEDGVLTSFRY